MMLKNAVRRAVAGVVHIGALALVVAAPLTLAVAAESPENTLRPGSEQAREAVARVISVTGNAVVASAGAGTEKPLSRGDSLYATDNVVTEAESAVRLLFKDRSVIDIGAASSLEIGQIAVSRARRSATVRLTIGRIWARVSSFFSGGDNFRVDTRTAVCGVRGTEFVVEIDQAGKTRLLVVNGKVELASLSGDLREGLGPMLSGSYDGTGEIVLAPVDPAELAAIQEDVRPRPSLGADDLSEIEDQGLLDPPASRLGPAQLDIVDRPAPPLEAEPSTGRTTIRGQLEVRE